MDYNAKSSQPEEVHEKIKAKYAGIISRKMTVSPYDGKTYFEIMYFDESEKEWHIGYGSFTIEFVQKWLEEEFEPTYKRIDEAITDLLARAEAAEARCARLEEARENANEACAKWETLCHMAEQERDTYKAALQNWHEEG